MQPSAHICGRSRPCPSLPHLHVSWAPPGAVTPPPPWAACASASPLLLRRNVPSIQPEPPLVQLEAINSQPIAVTWSRSWSPPHHNLLSGSCRKRGRETLPWVSSRFHLSAWLCCAQFHTEALESTKILQFICRDKSLCIKMYFDYVSHTVCLPATT